ncbi:hypothetical protein C0J52_26328 [Blattella germanica]|nr:hypothetical protein C0J52_26328 [Blattella germanica]
MEEQYEQQKTCADCNVATPQQQTAMACGVGIRTVQRIIQEVRTSLNETGTVLLRSPDGRTLLEPAAEVSTEVPPLQLPPLDGSMCLAEDVAASLALRCDSDPVVIRRRFSSSERGRQEEEIEQLNYRKPGSPTTRTSTNDGIQNARESRSEERRSRDTRKTNYSNEHGMSASEVEFRPSTRRKSKSPDGPNRDVEGTDITRLRSGTQIHKNLNKNNSNNRGFCSVFNKNNNSATNVNK